MSGLLASFFGISMSSHVQTVIIGIGNPMRCDDGVGWSVAQELSREVQREDVRIVATHQLTPEIAELVSHAERVLFIDAARGGKPGYIECKPVAPASPSHRFSHDLSAGEVVALSEMLYGHVPAAYLLTLAGEFFGTGEKLSARVTAALPHLKSQIAGFIKGDGP